MKRPLLRHSLALVALAATCGLALAQPQTTKDGKRVGTREDLRACMATRDEIESTQKSLKERGEKIAADSKALSAETEDLNTQVKQADDDGLTGLRRTRLERKVKEHDAKLKSVQDAEAAFNADHEAFDKKVAGYHESCSNVAFDNDDVAAVKKEREAAGKK